jgi:hypothetical protein
MSIDLTDPAWDAEAITPSDTINLVTPARMVYVGGAGAVAAVMRSGAVVTFAAVPVGTVLPIQVARINATSTTATNLVALR